jgi:hypothetical protein
VNTKSAPGSIGIEASIFKECADEHTPALSDLYNICWTFRVNPKKGTKRKTNHHDFSDDPIGILSNNKKRKTNDTFFKSSEPSNLSGSETIHEIKEETFINVNKKRGSRRSNIKVKTSNFDPTIFNNVTIERGSRHNKLKNEISHSDPFDPTSFKNITVERGSNREKIFIETPYCDPKPCRNVKLEYDNCERNSLFETSNLNSKIFLNANLESKNDTQLDAIGGACSPSCVNSKQSTLLSNQKPKF